MRNFVSLTTFIQEMSLLVDAGQVRSIEEVESHIAKKDLMEWLETEFPFSSEVGVDLSLFKKPERDLIHNGLYEWLMGYQGQERRKWGIENNGLCLLISWTTELVRDEFRKLGA
ncbi:hypothetical protein [Alicyclobacillus shizuokensis]|uniref:hypothetical protein n=1 Tax=Alicyclobacillus shizuokensis TaxID=392014 RepID=UPI00082A6A19|nr:hypothetical protein [Alicyclobacillus shizuokensis]